MANVMLLTVIGGVETIGVGPQSYFIAKPAQKPAQRFDLPQFPL
jgi:hypothetical protein